MQATFFTGLGGASMAYIIYDGACYFTVLPESVCRIPSKDAIEEVVARAGLNISISRIIEVRCDLITGIFSTEEIYFIIDPMAGLVRIEGRRRIECPEIVFGSLFSEVNV